MNPSFAGHVAEQKRMELFAAITVTLACFNKKKNLSHPLLNYLIQFFMQFRKLRLRGNAYYRECDPISLNFT